MATHKQVDTFYANATWTCPAGVTSVDVECWGAGGGGTALVGAGGGGAYSKKTVTVTPSTGYDVVVGTSAIDTNGGDSTFDTTAVVAKGGLSGTNGGTGGAAASGTGDTKFSGGDGELGVLVEPSGGSAGDSANGGNGVGSTPGIGGAANGAHGWAGIGVGLTPGAGAASTAAQGSAGGRGLVRLTYNIEGTAGYPAVRNRAWGRDTANTTTHTIDMPASISAGDILIIVFGVDSVETPTIGADWTTLDIRTSASNVCTQAIFYKIAEGGDTATVTTTAEIGAWITFCIQGAGTPEVTTAAATNPPLHTPSGGSQKYLWIATGVKDSGIALTSDPTGYQSGQLEQEGSTGGGVGTVTAEKFAEALSEDPGAFGGAAGFMVSGTISVPPAGGGSSFTPRMTLMGVG